MPNVAGRSEKRRGAKVSPKESILEERNADTRDSRHHFESPTALQDWLRDEASWWNSLITDLSQSAQVPAEVTTIPQKLADLAKECSQTPQRKLDELLADVQDIFENTHAFESGHSSARFVQSFLPNRPVAAAAALQYLLGGLAHLNSREALDGTISALLFRKGLARKEHIDLPALEQEWSALLQRAVREREETARSIKIQLADLPERVHAINTRIDSTERHLKTTLQAAERHAQSRIDKLATEAKANTAKIVSSFETDIERLTEVFGQKIDQISRTYEASIALKAPGEYWESKRRVHSKNKVAFAKVSGGTLAVVVASLLFLAARLFTDSTTIPVRSAALFLLVSVFGFWLVRVLLRLFMLHVTLEADAQERVIMVKTYLALLEQGATSPQEKLIVVGALFRPASHEGAKDEIGPASGLEVLTKLVGGK